MIHAQVRIHTLTDTYALTHTGTHTPIYLHPTLIYTYTLIYI